MATRLKTVEYWFDNVAALPDASATNATQITVYLPESSITFHSVVAEVQVHDANTTLTSVSQRQIEVQLGSAGYSAVNNTNGLGNGGENFCHSFSGNFTSYFTTNWTGTSMTCDCRLTINTGTLGSRNASVRLVITYEYDDTSATHVKTVWIPLDAPTSALGTTKPGTATDTIPDLSTYCPENSKTFRQTTIVLQGNTEGNSAVDRSISCEVDTNGAFTSGLFELGTTVDVWFRVNSVQSFTTNASHSFYLWGSTADFDHVQAWLVVTYEFTVSGTTTILNSLWLPMEFGGTFGGPTSADYQRGERELWIQEPDTITTLRVACLVFWDQMGTTVGLEMRVGTGSFVAYTSVATVLGGGCGAMIRNDSAFTFSRGRNVLTCDAFRADTVDLGYMVSAAWLVNYTSGVPADGVGAANHTVWWNLRVTGTVAAAAQIIVPATAPVIPETEYFITSVGIHYLYTSNGTGNPSGLHIGCERLASGEGGLVWENVYEALGGTDPETGIRQSYSTARSVFNRWNGDSASDRLPIETARRWRAVTGGTSLSHDYLDLIISYHSITFAVAGDVYGSAGGTVTLNLCRAASGERVRSTSRVGNGAYSINWFDNTENVFVEARESSTLLGRSEAALAGT